MHDTEPTRERAQQLHIYNKDIILQALRLELRRTGMSIPVYKTN